MYNCTTCSLVNLDEINSDRDKKMAGKLFYFQITLQKSSCFSVGWEGLDLQSIPKAEIHSPVKDVKSIPDPVQIAKNPDISVLKSNPTDL